MVIGSCEVCDAIAVQLVLSVIGVTIATLTLLLATRRLVGVISEIVFARYVAVGGMVAFSVDRDGDDYQVRFEVGGPGVFHNVRVHLLDLPAGDGAAQRPPALRHTMSAGDDPIEFALTLAAPSGAGDAWVMVTWVRPYLQGVDSEAIAQRLNRDQLYEWRWYSETTRYLRMAVHAVAQRYPRLSTAATRDLALYGRWRRTSASSAVDMLGPADRPPPHT